jgi:hypothetical protein
VELWRIGDSRPAPKFNVVSQPNDWTRQVSAASRAAEVDLSRLQALQLRYWSALMDRIGDGPLRRRKPLPQSWMAFPIGRTHFHLTATVNTREGFIRAELYIDHPTPGVAKRWFERLREAREEAEAAFGEPLDWQRLPDSRACRICVDRPDTDISQEQDWPEQHRWLIERVLKLDHVFRKRVKALPEAGALALEEDPA